MTHREGLKRKDNTQLVVDYGRIARNCVVDLGSQKTLFDYQTQTIYEAPTPLREDIKPERMEDVEEWLASFESEKLLDYISVLTKLNLPMAALYLDGPKGSGKSLLANGLSRLYSKDEITPLEAYFEDFNDALTMNPILVGDETIPKQLKGRDGTAELRKLVQSTNRLYKRKNMNAATLKGAFRIILLANNDRLIPSSYFLTHDDSLAVAERFIYIKLGPGPVKVMEKYGRKQCSKFITEDRIARHALYLNEERGESVNLDQRFLVTGGESAVSERLDYTGLRGDVCHFLYRVICDQAKIPMPNLLPFVNGEKSKDVALGVNAAEIFRNWNLVMGTDIRCPELIDLQQCVKSITQAGNGEKIRVNDKNLRYRLLDTSRLLSWARYMDISEEDIKDALESKRGKPSPQAAKEGFA